MPKESYHIVPGSEQHRRLITASKVASILVGKDGKSISPYVTGAELWHRMREELPEQESTPAMRRGHNQEASILAWFFTELRPDIEQTAGETTFTRPDLPWAAANPDAVADENGRTVFIDAKSIAIFGGGWGKPGTDQVPAYYVTQMLWAMHMTHGDGGLHVTRTYIVKHGPKVNETYWYYVDYSPRVAQWIEDACRAFYESLFDDNGCPQITERSNLDETIWKLNTGINHGIAWEISPELAREYVAAQEESKAIKARVDTAKAKILKSMGDAEIALCGGQKIGTRTKYPSGRISFRPAQKPIHLEDLPDTPTQAAA